MSERAIQSEPVRADPNGWRDEGRALLRGIAAGSIAGMPLLFTMEMWWHGMIVSAGHLLVVLGAMLLVNFCFSIASGFRPGHSVSEAMSESVTSVAIGMAYAAAILWLIGEMSAGQAGSELLGKVVITAAPVSLGICFANYQMLGRTRDGDEDDEAGEGASEPDDSPGNQGEAEHKQLRQDLTDFAATVGGATVFAYSVAPTEEIVLISSRLSEWHHLAIMAASLGLCYMILFAAGFKDRKVYVPGVFQSPLAETVMAYAVSLAVSFGLLMLIGVPEATSSPGVTVAMTVTLGLPAVVGASAGRLIV